MWSDWLKFSDLKVAKPGLEPRRLYLEFRIQGDYPQSLWFYVLYYVAYYKIIRISFQ